MSILTRKRVQEKTRKKTTKKIKHTGGKSEIASLSTSFFCSCALCPSL